MISQIIIHPTWNIIDSSKLQDFLMCPRYYFYTYILGWQPEVANHDLIFGEAWHAAMLWLKLHGYSEEDCIKAFNKFLEIYRQTFTEDTDELYEPKTPMSALKMLSKYTTDYASDVRDFKVLYGEVGGTVSLSEDRTLAFRLDTICQEEKGIFSLEHKTTKKTLNRTWFDQWELKIQVGTYAHVLHCLFPNENIIGVKINAASFMKTEQNLQRKLVDTPLGYMQNWLWSTLNWTDHLFYNMENLNECKEDDPIMFAFPMITESCTKYYGCRYLDYCKTWSNPLQHCYQPPLGMKIEYWNPLEQKISTRVEDGKLNT